MFDYIVNELSQSEASDLREMCDHPGFAPFMRIVESRRRITADNIAEATLTSTEALRMVLSGECQYAKQLLSLHEYAQDAIVHLAEEAKRAEDSQA